MAEPFGYPLSYVEFFGTALNMAAVYLVSRGKMATWPVGIVGVVLFGILFYQLRLYADCLEQVYYIFANLYGWWLWRRRDAPAAPFTGVRFSSAAATVGWLGVTLAGTLVLTWGIVRLPVVLPAYFPEAPSYPLVDALTTVASFVAMLLMAHKRLECWIYWLVIDAIGVWLYAAKGVVFVAGLYAVFLLMAVYGLAQWLQARAPRAAVTC